MDYVATWRALSAEAGADGPLLLGLWFGGSFASAVLDPEDIDASPVLDAPRLRALRGKAGAGRAKKLLEHRDGVRSQFGVEVFPYLWHPVRSTLFARGWTDEERGSLSVRGGLDIWWQRARPRGEKQAPTEPSFAPERGYLEVIL